MPTTRPRHTLTETPELARALDEAALLWPELRDDRAALVRKLVEIGWRTVGQAVEERRAARRAGVDRVAGSLTGVYPRGAALALKQEWPE